VDVVLPAVQHREVADGGIRFGLDQATFDRWWASAINPEDGEEFVHLLGGNMVGARFVCALDLLKDSASSGDNIVRAYCLAKELPEAAAREHIQRLNAQMLFDDPSVQTLIDRVTYRGERAARNRIANLAAARLEKLYRDSETGELEHDAEFQSAVLGNSAKFLGIHAREKETEARRRERSAVRQSIERGRLREKEVGRIPTVEEAVGFLHMLRDELGEDEFARILGQVTPKALEAK
jgi:hypothetical protein